MLFRKKYSKILVGYELKTTKENNMLIITARDKTGMKDINEIKLFFDKKREIKKNNNI